MQTFKRIFRLGFGIRLRRVWLVSLALITTRSGVAFVAVAVAPSRTLQTAAESRWVRFAWYPHYWALRSDTPVRDTFHDFVETFHGRAELMLCLLNLVDNNDSDDQIKKVRIGFPTGDEWNEMFGHEENISPIGD